MKGWLRALLIIIPFLIVSGIFEFIGVLVVGVPLVPHPKMIEGQTLVVGFFGFLGTLLVVFLFVRYVDRESFSAIGFNRLFSWAEFFYSALAVLVAFGVGFLLLLSSGQLFFESIDFKVPPFLQSVLLFIIVAVNEELFVRAYVLRNLASSFGDRIALLLSATLFCVLHFLNPNISWLAIVNLFLAGVLLGLAYLYKRSLWLPISIHFFWNFIQTHLGFEVSGQDSYSVITTSEPISTIWNGGAFGLEGSVIAVIIQLIAIVWLWWLYRRTVSEKNSELLPQVVN